MGVVVVFISVGRDADVDDVGTDVFCPPGTLVAVFAGLGVAVFRVVDLAFLVCVGGLAN
jgi:hypothetical protein